MPIFGAFWLRRGAAALRPGLRSGGWRQPLCGDVRPISPLRLSLLRFRDSKSQGNSLWDMRIPPLNIKFLLESNPLKSRILVRRSAVDGPIWNPSYTVLILLGPVLPPGLRWAHAERWASVKLGDEQYKCYNNLTYQTTIHIRIPVHISNDTDVAFRQTARGGFWRTPISRRAPSAGKAQKCP